jgi:hypothetical protein
MANKSWIPDAPSRWLGDRVVGTGWPVYITGEIGINHNGDLANAIALIDQAADAGCDAVKFQKRTPRICTPRDQWGIERDTPWGRIPVTSTGLVRARKTRWAASAETTGPVHASSTTSGRSRRIRRLSAACDTNSTGRPLVAWIWASDGMTGF